MSFYKPPALSYLRLPLSSLTGACRQTFFSQTTTPLARHIPVALYFQTAAFYARLLPPLRIHSIVVFRRYLYPVVVLALPRRAFERAVGIVEGVRRRSKALAPFGEKDMMLRSDSTCSCVGGHGCMYHRCDRLPTSSHSHRTHTLEQTRPPTYQDGRKN